MDNEEDFEKSEVLNDESESDFDTVNNVDNNLNNENSVVNDRMSSQNSNESSQTNSSNLKEKLEENKNKEYNKANSGKEAYQRKLDNNKDYYKNQLNNNKNEQDKLKNAKEENSDRRDSAEKRLAQAKQNRSNNRNNNTKSELKEAKKESKEAKREDKEQNQKEKQLKKAEQNIKKDSKKAEQFKKMHPVEAAKMEAKKKIEKVKKIILAKAAMVCLPIILGLFLIFFVIELILGPLMEAWGYIDEKITKMSDFSEKLDNFYSGFGFQNSKEAFYDEINALYDKYDSNLDIPLLLSTIFYTEGMGYDTNFGNTEAAGIVDGSVSGSNSGVLSAIRGYLKEKFDEEYHTVDENGLVYNVGKIYRLRKLARNQFNTDVFGLPTRRGTEKTMGLETFLNKYGLMISQSFSNSLNSIIGAPIKAINSVFKELWAWVLGSEYQGDFFDDAGNAISEAGTSILELFNSIFYGIADVTDVSLEFLEKDENGERKLFQIVVTVKTFEFDEENYNNYLMNYYLEHMPEFDALLPKESVARENKKKQIIREIYENKNLFKDIFLQYTDANSEVYTNNCVGAIDVNLVPKLNLPVSIKSGTSVNFVDGVTAFGIRDGVNHNGVDLNSSTAGVNEGNPVYAIASGEVVNSLPDVSCNTRKDSNCSYSQGAWVRIKHNIVIDNKEYNFYSVYMHLQSQSGQPAVGTKVNKGDIIGKIGNTGDSSGAHLHFEFREDDGSANGRAIDPTNLFIPCSSDKGFLVHKTTLSKEMFVSDLKNYCNRVSCSDSLKNIFVPNAELIYDVSIKNNVNPELIVVRAMAEGFSPGPSRNNYWGIGCTNTGGLSSCISFPSLEAGISGFANLSIVKNSTTAEELMKNYAYIGKYWYNPGSSSIGGCYYSTYIAQYLSASRVNIVSNACSSNKSCSSSGVGSCVATNEEDQNAYAKWQVANQMGKYREDIFGLFLE